MLASTATTLTWPEIAAITGVQTIWAASGTAIASASASGIQRPRWSRQVGPRTRMPNVAKVDRTNPSERASHGSSATSATTATHSTRTPRALDPVASPDKATTPMAAARSTLG